MEFKPWPKIPRWENEKYIFTEKIDGTNACVIIKILSPENEDHDAITTIGNGITSPKYGLWAQSRTKLIYPETDNYGFAKWVKENALELIKLGEGHHFGEWWGLGIQRGYDKQEKIFSLFNTGRWTTENPPPACCGVVPTLPVSSIEDAKSFLELYGSLASPGYKKVEGFVIYCVQTRAYYKYIMDK